MARITVEDCLPHIGNPFDLAMPAAERARQLNEGAPAAVEPDGHKPAVAALREIATGELNVRALREAAVERRQHAVIMQEHEDETHEPPAGDDFERRNEAAIAAGLEPLPVAGTTRDTLIDDEGGEDEDRAD